jgi:polyhydroxyalkanoate synthesis repressor PhaR
MSETREPRVIKRYANRKLYDMSESCYITHDEIAGLVRRGEEVRIIDNRTQEDLTSATLTQILLDEERRVKRPLPIDTIRNFFQSGGDFIQRKIRQPVANLREEAEKNMRRVLGRRDEKVDEKSVPLPEPPVEPSRAKQPAEVFKDALEERWVEIQHAFSQLDFPKRIADLEKRVATLEAELAEARGLTDSD